MGDHRPDDDPYAIRPEGRPTDAPTDQHDRPERSSSAGDKPPSGEQPSIDKETLRRVRRLIVVSALASITSVFLPPIGLVLGIVAAVLVWRWWSALVAPALGKATVVVVVFGTAFAVVVGAIGSTVAVMFASELAEYSTCQTGANTHQAQDKCWEELTGSVFGG